MRLRTLFVMVFWASIAGGAAQLVDGRITHTAIAVVAAEAGLLIARAVVAARVRWRRLRSWPRPGETDPLPAGPRRVLLADTALAVHDSSRPRPGAFRRHLLAPRRQKGRTMTRRRAPGGAHEVSIRYFEDCRRHGIWYIALALAGCGSSSKSSDSSHEAAPAKTTPTTAKKVRTAAAKSPCEHAAPTPASPGEVGAGGGGSASVVNKASVIAEEHGVRGKVPQVPLTAAEKATLATQLAAAKSAVAKYPTVKQALAAGYMMSTVYVPCIGAHYTNIGYALHFDPANPSELLFAGTSLDSKIVGLSYLVWHHNGPPPGFAGANDRWHQHNANGGLCLKGGVVIAGEESTRQECAEQGRVEDPPDRRVDGARVGRSDPEVRLGHVQRRVRQPRRQARRHRLRRAVPDQVLLAVGPAWIAAARLDVDAGVGDDAGDGSSRPVVALAVAGVLVERSRGDRRHAGRSAIAPTAPDPSRHALGTAPHTWVRTTHRVGVAVVASGGGCGRGQRPRRLTLSRRRPGRIVVPIAAAVAVVRRVGDRAISYRGISWRCTASPSGRTSVASTRSCPRTT